MKSKVSGYILLIFVATSGCAADGQSNINKLAETPLSGWRHTVISKLGLEIDLPSWALVREGSIDRWLVVGEPLTNTPVAATQFGITLSIARYPKLVHDAAFPRATNDMSPPKAVNAAHESTATISVEGDIYVIRDVLSEAGDTFRCIGHLNKTRVTPQQISDVQQIISSISEMRKATKAL